MGKFLFSLTVLGISLAACSSGAAPSPAPTASRQDLESAEQAVYATVLAQCYGAEAYVLMEVPQTDLLDPVTDETLALVRANLEGLEAETVDGYRARNADPGQLSDEMDLGVPYTLMSMAERRDLFDINQNGWEMFYARYPEAPGITALSRVGFNDALDQALVYVGTQSHWLDGAGYYVLLDWVNGAWLLVGQVLVWIS
ncbi:MAG: hypothetical protein JXB85_11310 [Anaerolineales bacterium]|nr:hypothetical protein [Anaerolineales bacterium]